MTGCHACRNLYATQVEPKGSGLFIKTWPPTGARGALHGNISRHPLEQSHQSVLSVFIRKRKTEETRHHCLHEKVSHNPEFDDEKQPDMEPKYSYLLT